MAVYCTKADVLARFSLVSAFTANRKPTIADVDRFINEASNKLLAALVGNTLGRPNADPPTVPFALRAGFPDTMPDDDSPLESWVRVTAVEGVLMALGQQLCSYGLGPRDADDMPWQMEFPMRLQQVEDNYLARYDKMPGAYGVQAPEGADGWQSGGATFRMDTASKRIYVKYALVAPETIDPSNAATYDGYLPIAERRARRFQ